MITIIVDRSGSMKSDSKYSVVRKLIEQIHYYMLTNPERVINNEFHIISWSNEIDFIQQANFYMNDIDFKPYHKPLSKDIDLYLDHIQGISNDFNLYLWLTDGFLEENIATMIKNWHQQNINHASFVLVPIGPDVSLNRIKKISADDHPKIILPEQILSSIQKEQTYYKLDKISIPKDKYDLDLLPGIDQVIKNDFFKLS
jgi:hypothetical protein